ncbi:hypothetical protein RRG01_04110 [Escherichia coli]|nr:MULTISPECIES: hypothetical protein [Escherichia]MCH0692401.1 hypothetical protein [Escherichia coli]MDT8519168.1 hypothetical protein [Escherichia coli]
MSIFRIHLGGNKKA